MVQERENATQVRKSLPFLLSEKRRRVHVHSEGGVLSEPEPGMSASAFEDNNIADLKTNTGNIMLPSSQQNLA